MPAPERLHIVVNAADGYERLLELGIDARIGGELTVDDVDTYLESLPGRIHRLGGWVVDETRSEVLLKVDSAEHGVASVKNHLEPPFEGDYRVAEEPPPQITQHGDYVFELQLC